MTITSLQQKVRSAGSGKATWLGKQALTVLEESAIYSQEWFNNSPFVKLIKENQGPFGELFAIIDKMQTNSEKIAKILGTTPYLFLESCYGINKAFNSRIHKGTQLETAARKKFAFDNNEQQICQELMQIYNQDLNLPKLNQDTQELRAAIIRGEANLQSNIDPMERLNIVREDLLGKLTDQKTGLLKEIANITGTTTETRRVRNSLNRRLRNTQNALNSATAGLPTFGTTTVISTNLAPIVATPAIDISIQVLNRIANWLLGSFLLNGIKFPIEVLGGLSSTVTSIVLKSLGSDGAEIARYTAAGVLAQFRNLLPTLFSSTGMAAQAWGFLMAYAPFIILAAIIILLICEYNKKLKLFDHHYLLAFNDEYPGLVYASILDSDDAMEEFTKMRKDLLELVDKQVEYSQIFGIGIKVKGKEKSFGGVDFNSETPVRLGEGKAESILEEFKAKYELKIPIGSWKEV